MPMTMPVASSHNGAIQKFRYLVWMLPVIAGLLAAVGVAALFSTAGGQFSPWASRHAWRALAGVMLMLAFAMIPLRTWLRLANPLCLLVLAMLLAVPLVGSAQFGARRWLGVGELSLQPAEFMKVALVLVLARYYQMLPPDRVSRPSGLLVPLLIIAAPVTLVLRQPDLGTAMLILATGLGLMFLAGVRSIYFGLAAVLAVGLGNLLWPYLREYQRNRLMTFLDPDRDPLGAGYHIAQSKIALGSGGFSGRGFLGGTQSQLNFLPEKHTDFIFTMLGEETGFIGAMVVMALYAVLIALILVVAVGGRNPASRLLAAGVGLVFALHVSVNIGMVTGLLPVVGVPLPLISYGGTSMLTLMSALGLVLSVTRHRDDRLRREEFGRFC